MLHKVILFSIISLLALPSYGQKKVFTRQDSLRGNTKGNRLQWDVKRYDIEISPDLDTRSIAGIQKITFDCSAINSDLIQIDLQEPMVIDKIRIQNKRVSFYKEGNVYWVKPEKKTRTKNNVMTIEFHGKPREAVNPPWDGGWIWKKDENGKPFVSVACQGLGASSWYPCKDTQEDEPELGATISIVIPDSLQAISNGKMIAKHRLKKSRLLKTTWEVKNPINNYNIIPYIGDYVNFSDTFHGVDGTLNLNYFVLNGHQDKAKSHFSDVKKMLKAFEYWFGAYPFYQDDYKLVEAPHLGMEHQSAIAYGNEYKKGYLGSDLSETGHGMNWDFIIVHESGHEWFGNNITSKDIADMWIHESFTNYSEALYIEYWYGKKAAGEYVQGLREKINNDIPIIGPYGVNQEGSGDMYNKGGNMIHTIRQIIDNDSLFREILRGLNTDFRHKTVNSKEVEEYIIKKSGKKLQPIFDQYLRDTKIPAIEIQMKNENSFSYRWQNVINGFAMPLKIFINDNETVWLFPNETEQIFTYENSAIKKLEPDSGFYIFKSKSFR